MKKTYANVVAIGMMALSLAAITSAREITKIDFDNEKEGAIASGFSQVSGQWVIKKDKTPSGKLNGYLAQTQEVDSKQPVIALYDQGGNMKDIASQVRVRISKGSKGQTAGLLLKYENSNNYLYVGLTVSPGSIALYKVSGGKVSQISKTDINIDPDVWHRLRVSSKNDHLSCKLNDQQVLLVQDKGITGSGKVGFIGVGALCSFDYFTLTNIEK